MADKSVVDRLSSLPNDILIDIVSRLPIRFAIPTECLSSRWRGLWTNITSVYVTNRDSETFSEFSAAFGDVVSQIQSPNIYNLTLHFIGLQKSQSYDYSWLREICDRNLCKLKLTWPKGCYRRITKLPSFIFQTSSLVSIELDTRCAWEFPDDDGDSNPINLPNLRYLRFHFSDCELLHKLINACPSLEELSLKCNFYEYYTTNFNCSNPNLRRLTVDLYFNFEVEVVINAPKLEYLAIYSVIRVTLKFEEKSIGLRELKILGKGCPPEETFVSEINGNWSIYNVRFLTLDVYTLHNISTRFCYVTQVSLDMYWTHDIEIVVHLMELCPVLDVLSLKCLMEDSEDDMVQTSDNTSTFFRGPSTITMEIFSFLFFKPHKSFLELIEYLLIDNQNLKHFHLKGDDGGELDYLPKCRRRRELNFCEQLYYSPTAFVECEVEFKGSFFNMSRKAGPKAWSTHCDQVVPFNDAPWNGFVFDEEE